MVVGARKSFFQARWHGAIPLPLLLWRDTVMYGTVINIAAGLAGLLLFAAEAPTALAAGVYFAPSPYNVFLFAAVWRTAESAEESQRSIARLVALVWLVASILV